MLDVSAVTRKEIGTRNIPSPSPITSIDKIPRPIKRKRISFLDFTHSLTSLAPKQPNMTYVRKFIETNNLYGINEGDQGSEYRAGGGSTPLMHAALYGFTELVKLYLELGANPHQVNSKGHSAISMARKHNYMFIVSMMEDWSHVGN